MDVRVRRGRIAGVLAVALAATAALTGAHPAYGIAGGTPAADGEYAFVAHLQIGAYERACTGALIDPEWVVTAAACFRQDGQAVPAGRPPLPTTVTLGAGLRGARLTVTELAPHAGRDVVLAKLASPVIDVNPAAVAATAPAAGETLQVAGFGRTATAWVPGRLHTTALNVQAVADATIDLAGSAAGAVCKGDAGGPTWRVRPDNPAASASRRPGNRRGPPTRGWTPLPTGSGRPSAAVGTTGSRPAFRSSTPEAASARRPVCGPRTAPPRSRSAASAVCRPPASPPC
jgi:hypothetical protein